jgi:UDP-N-acetyl-D-glucosamine dehydrogenase
VIDAASTKPYGFMPFYPGPGIGGHCIPLDPYYMAFQAKKHGILAQLIETSVEINNFMPNHVINLIEKGLEQINKRFNGSRIAILGLTYKKNISDTRESPAVEIINKLLSLGVYVSIYDPYIKHISTEYGLLKCEGTTYDALKNADCGVFLVDHDQFKALELTIVKKVMNSPVIIDCKNIFNAPGDAIYIGLGNNSYE